MIRQLRLKACQPEIVCPGNIALLEHRITKPNAWIQVEIQQCRRSLNQSVDRQWQEQPMYDRSDVIFVGSAGILSSQLASTCAPPAPFAARSSAVNQLYGSPALVGAAPSIVQA